MTAVLALLGLVLPACTQEDPLGPPGANMTGPVTSGSSSASGDESGTAGETGTPGDINTEGCDPLADPTLECGAGMACDLTSGICVPAPGDGVRDDPCVDTSGCTAGLICFAGRCRDLCAVEGPEGCEADELCVAAPAPIPGLCTEACELAVDACSFPGDACKRVVGAGGQVLAGCVPNPGIGLAGDPCLDDVDCGASHLCTPAATHTQPCVDEAPSCCTPVCDVDLLPCFGLEPICYTLAIPGQEGAGFCGAL